MTPVYQLSGASRGDNGDCFQACLATVLDLRLAEVPNFYAGLDNGKLLPPETAAAMDRWLERRTGANYIEFGYDGALREVLKFGTSHQCAFLLTGHNIRRRTHTVVCRGVQVIHDPATEPGEVNHTLLYPCYDNHYRVGIFVLALS